MTKNLTESIWIELIDMLDGINTNIRYYSDIEVFSPINIELLSLCSVVKLEFFEPLIIEE
jgi:hypothetical protein